MWSSLMVLAFGLMAALYIILRCVEALLATDGRYTHPRLVGTVSLFVLAGTIILASLAVLAWWNTL